MKLLIVTQAVDADDPTLGFFCRWIEEFAKRIERVEVICLKEGKHVLPANVRVHSLGKPASRFRYIWNFYRFIFSLRYDAVFVHMNEEYALLGGIFWLLSGKRTVLWRNHKMGSWLTRLAVALSNSVCYTSPDAFVTRYKNAVAMPVGIDTDFFTPPVSSAPKNTILFLGRLDPVKRAEVFIKALEYVSLPFHADIYGSSTHTDSPYARQLTEQARPLVEKSVLTLHPGVSHERTPELYRSHAIYVNLTPSGSFDKTIGEAMASGHIVVCVNRALQDVLPHELLSREDDVQDIARTLSYALTISSDHRASLTRRLRTHIEEHHSLAKLMERLMREIIVL